MDCKKYLYEKIVNSTKLSVTKNDDDNTILKKLRKVYKDDYLEMPITINNHNTYISKSILKPLLDELKHDWEKLNSVKQSKIEKSMKDEIFHSLAIESIQTSRRVIKEIIKNKEKPLNDQLVKNIIGAFVNLEVLKPAVNEQNLKMVYTILTTDVDLGYDSLDGEFYRLDNVAIGKDMGSDCKYVKQNMQSLFEYINGDVDEDEPVLKVLISHLCFELIHPYYDLNGRTGRILSWWLNYVKYKLPNLAYFSTSTCHFREMYLEACEESKKMHDIDLTYGVGILLSIMITQAKNYLIVNKIDDYVFDAHKVNLTSLQKGILMRFLAHKEIYNLQNDARIKVSEIWEYFKDFSQQIVYRDIQQLETYKIFVGSDTNPKQIKAIFWDKIKTDSNK